MARPGRAPFPRAALPAGALLLVLGLVAACTSAAAPAAPREPAPVVTSWPGCAGVGAFDDQNGGGPPGVGAVPEGFVARTAVLCEVGERTNARGDTVSVDLERTSTSIGPLLAYLTQPDERSTDGPCVLIGFVPPWLFLLDASGRYVAAAIPRDACHLPIGRPGERAPWELPTYTDRVVPR